MFRLSLPLLFAVLVCARAAAQTEYGARAVAQRPRLVATHSEDATAAGTALDLLNRVSLPRSLAEVVREAPGARVQSTGALGAFSSVSLRGADGNEALVMLDEIPLSTPDGGAFDLSLFGPELFERVDVFRGGAPVWLGSGAIGGVLRLVPRRDAGPSARAALGAGSFGLLQLHGGASAGSPGSALVRSQVLVRGARNDYPYLDDKGTLYDASDDEELRRKNAQLADASGYLDLTVPLRQGRLHVITLAQTRTGGYPGPASQPTPNIHRAGVRGLLGAGYELTRGGSKRAPHTRVQLVASAAYSLDRYSDLYGELGTSQRWETDDRSYRGFFRAAATQRLLRWLESTLVSSYAVDRYDLENRYTYPKPAPSTRHTAAAALELAARGKLGPVGFELRPSARVEWSRSELHIRSRSTGDLDAQRDVLLPTARIGAGILPFEDVALTASLATGGRLPTMLELFGDRGMVLPSAQLEPVTSLTYDAGIAWCTARERWSLSSELHGFVQQRKNAIAMYRNAQWQLEHENLSKVEQRGFELGLSGIALSMFSLRGSLSYLATENALGKRLPLRPQWLISLRPELVYPLRTRTLSSLGISSELYYRSFAFADQANLAVVPQCRTSALSLALGMFGDRVRLTGRMEDAADVRCTDLTGYPLPGRSLFFSLSYQEGKS